MSSRLIFITSKEAGSCETFFFTGSFGLLREKRRQKRLSIISGLKGKRVLVIDDNRSVGTVLKELLNSMSIETSVAASGEEGLKELEKASTDQPYDLVIVDWKMPGIDGIETSRRLLISYKSLQKKQAFEVTPRENGIRLTVNGVRVPPAF